MKKSRLKSSSGVLLTIIIVINLAALACLALLVYRNGWMRLEISRINNKTDVLAKKKDEMLSAQNIMAENEGRFADLRTIAVPAGDEVAFLGRLEQIAASCEVSIEIGSMKEEPLEGYQGVFAYLKFRLSVSGSYSNVMKFIRALELTPEKIIIDQVAMARGAAEEGKGDGKTLPKAGGWEGSLDLSVIKYASVDES